MRVEAAALGAEGRFCSKASGWVRGLVVVCVVVGCGLVSASAAHASQTTIGSGFNHPFGVAVDSAGDVFVADYSNNRVVEVPPGCTSSTCEKTIGVGFEEPLGVAVDSGGDVFVADSGDNRVVEVPSGCTMSTCQVTIGSGFFFPAGVAVDSAGDVFVADTYNSQVVEVPHGCNMPSCQITIGSGFNYPYGVAVDSAGDVFVADTYNNQVVEVPIGCTMSACQEKIGAGFSLPAGVALDSAGNVFVADYGNSRVVEVPPGCTTSSCQITIGSGFSFPGGVALDSAGDVFVGDYGNSRVVEVYAPPCASSTQALFLYPANGATGVDGSTPFSWCAASGASGYYLTVGTSPGGGDVVNSGPLAGSQTSFNTGSLPAGRTLYATIYTYGSGGGAPAVSDVTFTTPPAGSGVASFTAPTDGQSTVELSKTFHWSTVAGASGYYLTVGTTPGGGDVVNSGFLPASQHTYTPASPLPAGQTLYATIYTYVPGSPVASTDITFHTTNSGTLSHFTNPSNGDTGVATNLTLKWSKATGATGYYLLVGTTPGGGDVVNTSIPSTQNTYTTTLAPGRTYYATIYTYTAAGGAPSSQTITFNTYPSAG